MKCARYVAYALNDNNVNFVNIKREIHFILKKSKRAEVNYE